MILTALLRPAALAGLVAVFTTAGAAAQTTAVDPHHPDATPTQATPPSGAEGTAGQGGQPGQPGMMPGGMMGPGMMRQGMVGGMPMMPMRGHMMKIMFAIADADGDGGLSFEEVSAIHKRIFDKVDANKDGKVFPEEIHAFMTP